MADSTETTDTTDEETTTQEIETSEELEEATTEETETTEEEEETEDEYVPVTIQEVCDHLGFLVSEVEEDEVVKRNIIRLINFSNLYLQGAIGKEYPTDDERAKQIALLVIGDLYDYRDLDSKNISNTTRKLLNDLEWQLKTEMLENGDE